MEHFPLPARRPVCVPVALLLLLFLPPMRGHAAVDAPVFYDATRTAHTLGDLQGHIAVVNFWATWCGPCQQEMPRLQKIAEQYGPRGITFVAVSLDAEDTQHRIAAVTAKRHFAIPVWTGATAATLRQLDLGVLVPATLILDEKGDVLFRIEGEASDSDVRSRLDWLLNGRGGKRPKAIQKNDW